MTENTNKTLCKFNNSTNNSNKKTFVQKFISVQMLN